MKQLSALILSATLSCAAWAENPAWQASYQYETAGKYLEAIGALEMIPATDPDGELKLLRRGWLFYSLGRYDDSIREYEYAIKRNPASLDAKLGIVLPFLAAKRWREAENRARHVLGIAPNNYLALLRLSVALEAQQNWAEMEKFVEKLVNNFPSDATAFVYLARAKIGQGRTSEAAKAYAQVLARYPGHLEAKNYLSK